VGVITIRKSVVLLSLACGITLVVSNTLLASRVAQLRRLDDFFNRSNKLQPGDRVPPLVGYDVTGKKMSYEYGSADARDTLLLVLSPTCHACDDNWPNWTRMVRELKSQNMRLLIANIAAASPLTSDYLAKHEVATASVVAEVSAESMEAYKLAYTPQTILIAPDGKVLKVRTGMLKEGDLVLQNWTDPPEKSRAQSQSSMSLRR
jgi:AhpC/TSA family